MTDRLTLWEDIHRLAIATMILFVGWGLGLGTGACIHGDFVGYKAAAAPAVTYNPLVPNSPLALPDNSAPLIIQPVPPQGSTWWEWTIYIGGTVAAIWGWVTRNLYKGGQLKQAGLERMASAIESHRDVSVVSSGTPVEEVVNTLKAHDQSDPVSKVIDKAVQAATGGAS